MVLSRWGVAVGPERADQVQRHLAWKISTCYYPVFCDKKPGCSEERWREAAPGEEVVESAAEDNAGGRAVAWFSSVGHTFAVDVESRDNLTKGLENEDLCARAVGRSRTRKKTDERTGQERKG